MTIIYSGHNLNYALSHKNMTMRCPFQEDNHLWYMLNIIFTQTSHSYDSKTSFKEKKPNTAILTCHKLT